MVDHVSPEDDRLAVVAASSDDGPVVMLNLNRYREFAEYPEDHPNAGAGRTGREAYLSYGAVAYGAIKAVGGEILWATDASEVVIGCDHDAYDEVVAVWYPSRTAFLSIAQVPGYPESHVHRDAAVAQATLIATRGERDQVLRSPF